MSACYWVVKNDVGEYLYEREICGMTYVEWRSRRPDATVFTAFGAALATSRKYNGGRVMRIRSKLDRAVGSHNTINIQVGKEIPEDLRGLIRSLTSSTTKVGS